MNAPVRKSRAIGTLRSAASTVFEFVVGDDWRTALGVCAALALVAVLAAAQIAAWWVMPLAVPGLLWRSLIRAAGRSRVREKALTDANEACGPV